MLHQEYYFLTRQIDTKLIPKSAATTIQNQSVCEAEITLTVIPLAIEIIEK